MSNNTDIDKDELIEKAIQTFDKMKGRIKVLEDKLNARDTGGEVSREPIAVIGMACRFPGNANSPEAFWDNLINGRNAITEVPGDRFDIDEYYDPDTSAPGKIATRYGAFIEEFDQFDPKFFGISPREAGSMDPQQCLVLEVAWEAFENSGLTMEKLRGSRTGVYLGATGMEYAWNTNASLDNIDGYSSIGTLHMFVANRLSYYLDLKGPSITLDTGCSSSLHTVHLACRSLREGESSMAIAGGVNLMLSPHAFISYSKNQMLSPNGQCFTFDSRANGFVRGEGCGMVVLKRLSDARADGDDILAVIRGSAVNQDGTTSVLTAPNGLSQEQCIRSAVADAGIKPDEISCIEAHGTGTPLGDPIEVEALDRVYGNRAADKFAYLSSVKTNIGHLESAAGIAGLMKMILSLRNKRIAPHLNYRETNPELDLESTPFVLPLEVREWPDHAASRLACVSSFGAGGSNSHIILEQGPDTTPTKAVPADRRTKFLALSAQSEQALRNSANMYAEQFVDMSDEEWNNSIDNLGRQAALTRTHFDFRFTGAAETRADFIDGLQSFARGEDRYGFTFAKASKMKPRLVFFFSGQGPTWWPLNPDFLAREKVFRESLERTDAEFQKHADWSLIEEMTADPEKTRLGQSAYTQPALFAYQVAIAELWKSRGIFPDAVIGHSMGEVPAAHVAGALNLRDAVRVIYHRGRLIQTVTGQGRMAAVDLSMEQAQEAIKGLEDKLSVGANNGPTSAVLSGEPAALEKVLEDLQKKDIFCRVLESVDFASHSPQMEPLRAEFGESLQGIEPTKTTAEFYSTVTGGPINGDDVGPEYWPTNLRSPVLFAGTIDKLIDDGYDIFLEIAPHPVLSVPVSQCLQFRSAPGTVLPSLRRNQDENITMWGSMGALHAAGFPLDWDIVYPVKGPRVRLPNYAWDKQKYWIDWDPGSAPVPGKSKPAFSEKVYRDWLYEVVWTEANRQGNPAKLKNNLLIFNDKGGQGDALRRAHAASILVEPGDGFARDEDGNYSIRPDNSEDFAALFKDLKERGAAKVDAVVFLWGLDLPEYENVSMTDLKGGQDLVLGSSLRLLQAMIPADLAGDTSLWIVTRDVHTGDGGKPAEPLPALLWGFGRTIEMEHGNVWGGLIDLDAAHAAEHSAEKILREIAEPDGEGQISFQGEARLVSRLDRYELKEKATGPIQLRKDGTYIVSGGQAGLGLVVAQWLAKRGAGNLVLTGRTELPPREEWSSLDGVSDRVRDRIKDMLDLEARGARVLAVASDVGSETAMRSLVEQMDAEGLPPVRGVIHAAAVFHAEALMKIEPDAFLSSLDAKVLGAALLDKLFRDSELDFLFNFSSVAALLGNFAEGMGSYSASNAFVDSLAQHRAGKGLPVTNVNWGLWEGAGSGATTELGERITEGLKKKGIFSFSPDQGIQVMERLLGEPDARVGVLSIDWLSFRQYYAKAVKSSLLKDLIEKEQKRKEDELRSEDTEDAPDGGAESEDIDDDAEITRQDLILVGEEDRRILLEYFVLKHTARVMRIKEEKLTMDTPLRDLGLDSILAVELRNVVESVLEVPLPTAKLLDGSSIEKVVEGLSSKLADDAATAQGSFSEQELSYGQRALWYQYSLHSQDPAYNVCLAVEIRGELNEDILKQAFQALHERHGILRSTFSEREGEPVRLVHDSIEADFFAGDASIWTDEELSDLLTEASHLPFYAEYGPLCRCRLYTMDDEQARADMSPEDRRYILLLSAHMLIADNRTLQKMTRELGELYFAEINGDSPSLPQVQGDYGDFAVQQREALQGSQGEEWRNFWERELSGELAILQMPLDFPRPQTLQNLGETHAFNLSDVNGAKDFATPDESRELYTRLLAAWQLLLHRYTQQNDVLVGVPGLEHGGDFQGVLGPFSNPVVLRAKFAAGMSVGDFLERTRETVESAFAHQRYPFSALVGELNPARYPGRNPIFQCTFELENGADNSEYIPFMESSSEPSSDGFDMRPLPIERDIALYDLHLKVVSGEDGLSGELRYNSELFAEEKIQGLMKHYRELVEGLFTAAAADPVLSIAPPEREGESVETRPDAPDDQLVPEINFARPVQDIFESRVALIKGVPAIKSGPLRISYADLEDNANQLANFLRARGLELEEPVVVFMPRSPEAVLAILAVLKAGGAFVPVDSGTSLDTFQSILAQSGARFCLSMSDPRIAQAGFQGEVINIPADWDDVAEHPATVPELNIHPDNIAALLYGGVEDAKGVIHSHRSILNSVSRQMRNSTLKFASRSLQFASLNSYYFLLEVFSTWTAGATLVQPDRDFLNQEAELVHYLIDESVERAFLPYSILNAIAEVSVEQEIRPYYLREIYAVGERLYVTQDIVTMLKALPGCDLHYQYATMESGLISDYAMESLTVGWPAMLPIGRALPGVEILILDDSYQPIPAGIAGELYISSDSLALGYRDEAALTAERFIPHMFGENGSRGARLFRSGLKGLRRPDGNIELLGHLDNRVRVRGLEVNLEELEASLEQHPAIRQAKVISRPGVGGTELLAYIASRRIVDRLTILIKCEVETKDGQVSALIADDISPSGMSLVNIPDFLTSGLEVKIKLILPGITNEVVLDGEVKRVEEEGKRAGIHFKSSPMNQSLLRISMAHIIEMEALSVSQKPAEFRVPMSRTCTGEALSGSAKGNKEVHLISESLSMNDITLTGISRDWEEGELYRISIELPGVSGKIKLRAELVWADASRGGFKFNMAAGAPAREKLRQFFMHYTRKQLLSVAQLRAFLQVRLPHYLIPEKFIILDHLPENMVSNRGGGKADVFDEEMDKAANKPRTPVEGLIYGIWADIIGRDDIGIKDNFFDKGGQSLFALRVLARMSDEFNVDVPLSRFLESPTIADLAALIVQNKAEERDSEAMNRLMAETGTVSGN